MNQNYKMKVIIVGAGIGGLTAALALHKIGLDVVVLESAKEIKPLGVGINLLPHSVRVLTHLGIIDRIASKSIATSDLNYYNRFGQLFWNEPRGKSAGYKWPQYSIHRGVLQMELYKTVLERLGPENVLTNHHVTSFIQDDDQMRIQCRSKESNETMEDIVGKLLVGADGINSVVRSQLFPSEGLPKYSENVLYRGVTRMKDFLNGSTMVMIGSLKQKMVVYPIDPNPDAQGNYLINWVGNLKEGQSSLFIRDWNRESDKGRLVQLYKNWNFDWLNVPEMISRSNAVYEFPMSDRDPLNQWTFGRVTLLGDAAHPMYPIGSNGASQAILDADALADKLMNYEPVKALERYQQERLPATTKVVLQNRAKGPDQIMDLMEERFPKGFTPDQIPHDELSAVMDNYRKVAGFDIQSLNAKS